MPETPLHTGGRFVVVAALSVAILLIAGGYQFAHVRASSHSAPNSKAAGATAESKKVAAVDSDGDGMSDWQEELLGSDPRDPESTAHITSITQGDTSTKSGPSFTTATEQVAYELTRNYLSLKQIDAYTQERGTYIGENLVARLDVPTTFEPYTENDVAVDSDISYERMITYRGDLQRVFEPLMAISEPEFATYARVVESLYGDRTRQEGEEALASLLETARIYEEVAEEAVAVTIPKDALKQHLAVVNALAYFGSVLYKLGYSTNDPVGSLVLLKSYNDAENYVYETFRELSAYYTLKHHASN